MARTYHGTAYCATCGDKTAWYRHDGADAPPACGPCRERCDQAEARATNLPDAPLTARERAWLGYMRWRYRRGELHEGYAALYGALHPWVAA